MRLDIPVTASQTGRSSATVTGNFSQRTTLEIKVVIPNTTNDVTFTFDMRDREDAVRYSMSGLLRNASTVLFVSRVLKPGYTVGITPSGAPGSDVTVSVYIDSEVPL